MKTKNTGRLYRTPEGATHRVLTAIIHERLNKQTYRSVADLTEDVKRVAARQRLPYSSGVLSDALARVELIRPLVQVNTCRMNARQSR